VSKTVIVAFSSGRAVLGAFDQLAVLEVGARADEQDQTSRKP
jgi:hypothetical protein